MKQDAATPLHAVTADRMIELVGEAFGAPGFIGLTGSLAAGYGNRASDIDVYAVVDGPVMQIPIAAYEDGHRVDVRYFGRDEVTAWPALLRTPPDAASAGHAGYKKRRAALQATVRFALARVLAERDELAEWSRDLRGPWLGRAVADWWAAEARRRALAAAWLDRGAWEPRWLRAADAGLAALECRAARSGHLFFGAKWLGEKFRQSGDADALAALRRCLAFGPPDDLVAFTAFTADLVASDAPFDAARHRWALTPATGVEIHRYLGRYVVSRWNMRGAEVPEDEGAPLADPARVWTGRWDERPDPVLLALLEADLLWLSVITDGSAP
ncbi:hypothetical protein [Actinomadura rayongensis]|uniref:hypothetical protein n=1 Tax=Actinomadura rayongensis TaxID=1429076 RepID=UPI0013682864|nr:hypothetical protein [Actinomadura rayongensis]